jgi:hypothetical protein
VPTLEELRRMFDATAVREHEAQVETQRREAERQEQERQQDYNAKANRPNLGLGYAYWMGALTRENVDNSHLIDIVEIAVVNPAVDATSDDMNWSVLIHEATIRDELKYEPLTKAGRWTRSNIIGSVAISTYSDCLTHARESVKKFTSGGFNVMLPHLTERLTPPWCSTCNNRGWVTTRPGNIVYNCPSCKRFGSDADARDAATKGTQS